MVSTWVLHDQCRGPSESLLPQLRMVSTWVLHDQCRRPSESLLAQLRMVSTWVLHDQCRPCTSCTFTSLTSNRGRPASTLYRRQ
jgi:hypothetical protein